MKKICFLTSTLNYGGATKIMIELANYLTRFFEVSIVNYGDKELFYSLEKKIIVYDAPKTKCNIPKLRLVAQMKLIHSFFRKKKFDVIIAFGNTEKLMALSACIGKNTKVIFSERQDPYNYYPGKKHTMWLRYIMCDGCVFQTEGAMEYFPRIVQNKSVIIPNFIIMDNHIPVEYSNRKKEIAFSARFELKQKRQDIMVEAMRIVSKKHPDWKLVFYGDGPDEETIKKMVSQYGLSDKVVFSGRVSNVNEKVGRSSILALSSDYEGIPNVIMEAMAMGVPVVTTDCSPGGARILIENDVNGKIVNVRDPESLATAILDYIENPQKAEIHAKKALSVKIKYSPERILPQWVNYLNKVVESENHN